MPSRIYPGLATVEECYLLNAVSWPFLLDSGLSAVLAVVEDARIEVDLYGHADPLAEELVDRVDTRLMELAGWPLPLITVRWLPSREFPVSIAREAIGHGRYPVFLGASFADVVSDELLDRLPWVHRESVPPPSITSAHTEIENLNVAELILRTSILATDTTGIHRVVLMIEHEHQRLRVIVTSRQRRGAAAEGFVAELERRLRLRPEVQPPWRWVVEIDDSVEPSWDWSASVFMPDRRVVLARFMVH